MTDTRSTTALECVECGAALSYRGTGRRPRYCSQTCRNRAYEARRAARTGAVATEVVERVVEVEARLNADAVVRWLEGHPRRLSAVLRGMEWTRELQDGLRYGLENAATDQVVIARQERECLSQMYAVDPLKRLELARLQHRVESLTRANERLTCQLQEALGAATSSLSPGAGDAPQAAAGAGYKTVSVHGKDFRVPANWTRQQARQWCREHPEQGVVPGR